MNRIIRRANKSDCEQMVEIYRPAIENSCTSFELETPGVDEFYGRVKDALKRHEWLVMEEQGRILGYAYGTTHRHRPAYRYSVETSVYLDRTFHRQGIGRQLYAHLLSTLAGLGYHNAFAGITLPNQASVALHESLGFEAIGVFREIGFKNDSWHDVGWWQCSLPAFRNDSTD